MADGYKINAVEETPLNLPPQYLRQVTDNISNEMNSVDIWNNAGKIVAEESAAMAIMKPVLYGGEALGLIDDSSIDKDPTSTGNILRETIRKSEERKALGMYGAGDAYGATLIENIPEAYSTMRLPLSAYSAAIAPFRGGTSWMAGGFTGLGEGLLYEQLRTGENAMSTLKSKPNREDYATEDEYYWADDNWRKKLVGHAQFTGSSFFGAHFLGKFHRGYIDAEEAMGIAKANFQGVTAPITRNGKTKYYNIQDGKINGKPYKEVLGAPNTVTIGEIAGYSTKAAQALYQKGAIVGNTVSNFMSGGTKQLMLPAGVAAGVMSQQDAEAGMFNFGAKMADFKINVGKKPLSSQEVDFVMQGNNKKFPHDSTAQAVANEEKLVTSYDDLKNLALDELPSDMLETVGKEFARNMDSTRTNVHVAMDDIIGKSHLEVKNKPTEMESFYAKNIDDAFPLDVSGNKEIRDSLGNVFRTGAEWDDVRTFMKEGTEGARGYASHKLASKLDDVQLRAIDDFIDEAYMFTKKPDQKMSFAKNSKSALKSLGVDSKLVDELADAVDLKIKAKGFDNLQVDDVVNLNKAVQQDIQAVRTQFGARGDINAKTDFLVKSGELDIQDAIFGYVKPKYENQYKSVTLTENEFKSMSAIDGFSKKINSIFGDGKGKIVKSTKNEDGTYSVLMKDNKDFIQGALPVQDKNMRGVAQSEPHIPIKGFKGKPSKVSVSITNKQGEPIVHNEVLSYSDYKLRRQGIKDEFIDNSTVVESKRPLTAYEQDSVLGMSRDIGDVTGHTVASVQRNLAKDGMYRDIKSNNSTSIQLDDVQDFMANAQTDAKYIFVNPADIEVMGNKDFMQFISNNYVKIDDPEMVRRTGARYVQKQHVYDLMGYQKTFMTRDKYSIGRYIEELYQDSIDMFRGAVIIKNPVALVNNTVGMGFTNYSYMYMNYGKLSNASFTGLKPALNSYKEFKTLKGEMASMRALGASDEAVSLIEKQLESNMAYQLYKRGGLQSLLDDGLLTSRVTKAAQEDNVYKTGVKNVFLTEDSTAGAFARNMHDQSDISNRVNLFSMLVSEGKTFDEAARLTTNVSVSYSRLLSPSMMFARSNGIMPFITWYSRIAPVMVNEIMKNPVRFAQLQGMYLASVAAFGSENQYGDDYIGGVRVESFNWFNALAPSNLLDPISPPILQGGDVQLAPQYMDNSIMQNIVGLTGGNNYE